MSSETLCSSKKAQPGLILDSAAAATAGHTFQVTALTGPEAFDAAASEWNACVQRSGMPEALSSAQALAAAWRHHERPGRLLWLQVRDAQQRLVGGLPLYRCAEWKFGAPVRVLRSLMDEAIFGEPFSGIVADEPNAQAVTRALKDWLARRGDWDMWRMTLPLHPVVGPRLLAVGHKVVQGPLGGRDVAPLGTELQVPQALPVGLHEAASQNLSEQARMPTEARRQDCQTQSLRFDVPPQGQPLTPEQKALERARQRLEASYPLTFDCVAPEDESWQAAWKVFLECGRRYAAALDVGGYFGSAQVLRFHERLIAACRLRGGADQAPQPVLILLRWSPPEGRDAVTVAAAYGVRWERTLEVISAAADGRFLPNQAGQTLAAYCVSWAREQGIKTVRFLASSGPQTLGFPGTGRMQTRVTVFNTTPAGRWAAWTDKQSAKAFERICAKLPRKVGTLLKNGGWSSLVKKTAKALLNPLLRYSADRVNLKELSEPIPDLPAWLEAALQEVSRKDTALLKQIAALKGLARADKLIKRLGRGHRCFVLSDGPQVAFFIWVSTREWGLVDGGYRRLPAGYAYLYDAITAPALRSRGYGVLGMAQLLSLLKTEGFAKAFCLVADENKASWKSWQRLGVMRTPYRVAKWRWFGRWTWVSSNRLVERLSGWEQL